jgi:hypothetical protein
MISWNPERNRVLLVMICVREIPGDGRWGALVAEGWEC